MVGQNTYVPPDYIPIGQSDAEADVVPPASDVAPAPLNDKRLCWTFLPLLSLCEDCRVYGSGMLTGSCMTHFILWDLVNSFCCVLTEGCMMGLSGCFVACYVCGYRKALRSKYNLECVKNTEKSVKCLNARFPAAWIQLKCGPRLCRRWNCA